MKRIKAVLLRFIYPGALWSVLIAAAGIGLLVFIFATGREKTVFGSVSYPITLYAVIVIVLGFPNIIAKTKALISKNKLGHVYVNDFMFRARISLYFGLAVDLLFVAFYAVTGWYYVSAWFGAVAGYYSILSVIRFILLRSVRKINKRKNRSASYAHELRIYRFCGCLMIALNLAMSGMIIQMVWQNKGYQYPGFVIYLSAIYAFYCMITAVINMVRFRKMDSPVLSAAKMLSFAGALMSMLALQTAMIFQFGKNQEDFRQIMNTVSGGAVFLTVFCMAVFMVVHANRELGKCVHKLDTPDQQSAN